MVYAKGGDLGRSWTQKRCGSSRVEYKTEETEPGAFNMSKKTQHVKYKKTSKGVKKLTEDGAAPEATTTKHKQLLQQNSTKR